AYLPMGGIIIAFKEFRISGASFIENLLSSPWVGFKNFRFLFLTPNAINMTKNTVLYNLTFMVLQTIFPIGFAIGLNELRNKHMAKVYQAIFFVTFFLSWVTVSYFVYSLLNPNYGLLNNILKATGRQPIQWYMEPKYWPFIIVLAHTWKSTGPNIVIWLAALAGIDPELYDAAAIDGASKWQQIKYITLPSLVPLLIILNILAVGRIFGADFGLFYTLPRGSGPLLRITEVIDVYIYKALMQSFHIGMSAAAGLYQAAVGFVLVLTTNTIVRKIDKDKAVF
ncbi:MAG: ABC transporter permease subunit, partial [Firmicutes bacterium]|nr:ABC transporter permease subunit [Bacillota bacterium]